MDVGILGSCTEDLSRSSDSCVSGVSLDEIFGDVSIPSAIPSYKFEL